MRRCGSTAPEPGAAEPASPGAVTGASPRPLRRSAEGSADRSSAGAGGALRSGKDAYRTYFLDLGGLGVRDLCRDGDDVLVLAGPTMDVDGRVRLHRWTGAARERGAGPVRREQVPFLHELPHGRGRTRGRTT